MPARSPVAVVSVVLGVVTGAALLLGCSSGDDGGDTQQFCADVAANVDGIVTRPATDDDVDDALGLYRRLADGAPIAIEEEWRDLLVNVETVSTVVPEDPESIQRAVAMAYATEKSAVAVRNWVLANCGVDLGPVATIAPQDPAATTTLPAGISTSIVTVAPPATLSPDTTPPTLAAQPSTATTAAG